MTNLSTKTRVWVDTYSDPAKGRTAYQTEDPEDRWFEKDAHGRKIFPSKLATWTERPADLFDNLGAAFEPSQYHSEGSYGFFSLLYAPPEKVRKNRQQRDYLDKILQRSVEDRESWAVDHLAYLKAKHPKLHKKMQHLAADDLIKEAKKPTFNNKLQRTYPLSEFTSRLGDLLSQPDQDSYISQADFKRPNRRAVNVMRMQTLFVYLDTYNEPTLAGIEPEAMAVKILQRCEDVGIPEPSVIIYSGRGYYAKWFIKPLPSAALPRWSVVEKYLIKAFKGMGVDENVKDVSRVLRLVGTINQKSGDKVRILHLNDDGKYGDQPVVYSFDTIADTILPFSRDDARDFIKKQSERKRKVVEKVIAQDLRLIEGGKQGNSNLRAFSPRSLAWLQVEDYRAIAAAIPPEKRHNGMTNELIWLAASALGIAVWGNVSRFYDELLAVARDIAPHWPEHRIKSSASSVYARVKAMGNGEWSTHPKTGEKIPPVYTPRHMTIIEKLKLEDDLCRGLKVIIPDSVKRERSNDRDRTRNSVRRGWKQDRASYVNDANDRRSQAKYLSESKGLSTRAIATEMGVNQSTVARWLKAR